MPSPRECSGSTTSEEGSSQKAQIRPQKAQKQFFLHKAKFVLFVVFFVPFVNYLEMVEAVVVVRGVPISVVSGTFSIVISIKSSTTAFRSFVSR